MRWNIGIGLTFSFPWLGSLFGSGSGVLLWIILQTSLSPWFPLLRFAPRFPTFHFHYCGSFWQWRCCLTAVVATLQQTSRAAPRAMLPGAAQLAALAKVKKYQFINWPIEISLNSYAVPGTYSSRALRNSKNIIKQVVNHQMKLSSINFNSLTNY